MAGGFEVERDAMAKGGQAVEEATVLIKQHMQHLDSEVETMFGGWRGDAQRAYGTLHANWITQQNKLNTALQDMHTALVQTRETYVRQEEEHTSQFGHISGQL